MTHDQWYGLFLVGFAISVFISQKYEFAVYGLLGAGIALLTSPYLGEHRV